MPINEEAQLHQADSSHPTKWLDQSALSRRTNMSSLQGMILGRWLLDLDLYRSKTMRSCSQYV